MIKKIVRKVVLVKLFVRVKGEVVAVDEDVLKDVLLKADV